MLRNPDLLTNMKRMKLKLQRQGQQLKKKNFPEKEIALIIADQDLLQKSTGRKEHIVMKVIMIVRAMLNISKEKDQVLMIVMAPTGIIIQHEYAVL